MVGQLPGFQGNVPIELKNLLKDSNMTDNKIGTGWMDSLDPNYAIIADEWMKEMINDFGVFDYLFSYYCVPSNVLTIFSSFINRRHGSLVAIRWIF
jgi:hypothetical protein